MQLNHARPFLEVIDELAQRVKPYPQRLVEQFHTIPRELFIPESFREVFGDCVQRDEGYAGLLSQPSVIFCMVAALFLKGRERVFEGGTGTGYQTAILARLSEHVYTIEVDRERLEAAKVRLLPG